VRQFSKWIIGLYSPGPDRRRRAPQSIGGVQAHTTMAMVRPMFFRR